MRQLNEFIIPSQDAASLHSAATLSLNLFACSVQITVSGGGAGTLILEASNDDFPAPQQPTNFNTIATVTVTGDGSFLIPKTDLCYQWVRVSYTNSGTGTMAAVLKALGE